MKKIMDSYLIQQANDLHFPSQSVDIAAVLSHL